MSIEQTIQSADSVISTELAAFRKHITALHLSFAGYVVIIALALGALVLHNVHSYERLLDKADARYASLQKDLKDNQSKYEADVKDRANNDKQVQVIVKQVDAANKKADAQIKTVTAPHRTQEQVAQDSQNYLGVVPTISADGLFGYHAPSVQQFIATKIDADRLKQEVVDNAQQMALERSSKDSLGKDLASCQTSLGEAGNVIKGYQKAAKKGKWRKGLDVVEKVGGFLLGVYVGRKL